MVRVTLYAEGVGVREFDSPHAQRLLRLEEKLKVKNWVLHSTKHKYENGQIVPRADNREDKVTEEQAVVNEGDQS